MQGIAVEWNALQTTQKQKRFWFFHEHSIEQFLVPWDFSSQYIDLGFDEMQSYHGMSCKNETKNNTITIHLVHYIHLFSFWSYPTINLVITLVFITYQFFVIAETTESIKTVKFLTFDHHPLFTLLKLNNLLLQHFIKHFVTLSQNNAFTLTYYSILAWTTS